MVRRIGLVLLTIAVLISVLTMNSQAQSVLTRHVREVIRTGEAKPIGQLPSDRIMKLDVVLTSRDQPGLDAFLRELYDPASPSYRHFLTVPEFTERFGPTQEDYDAVVRFAEANGFAVVGGTRDGMDVQIEGPISAVETAFHVAMGTYQHPTESRTFYAPDREPTTDLPFPLWHISGLDNYSIPHPMFVKKSDYAKAHGIDAEAVVSHATTGSGPSASFLGSDMRAAYYGETALTGAGQNIGLLEYYGYNISDLNTYYTNASQTRTAAVTGISTDGTSLTCLAKSGCDDTEQILDMTQSLGMAPGITTLYVYVGSTDTAILSAMTTDTPLPAELSSSWTWTPADPKTDDPYFEKMAAQGQSFFQAAGDSDAWSSGNDLYPSEDANVICVGGTDLTTSGVGGPWSSEIGWADGGGGISPDHIAIPSWQQPSGVINSSNEGSTVYRNGPDVSANANFSFYVCADQTTCTANEYGGTSFAAPMWAGYVALANQQEAANGDSAVGFINPTIYPIGVSSSYDTDFHDITSGNNGFPAVIGYDLDSGWGSPNGTGLIDALAPKSTTPAFTISASPASLSVVQGGSGKSTITTTVSGGFDSSVALTASGQPTGVTVSLSPTSVAAPGSGTSTITMALASTTAAGTYTITITGTGGGITHTATVSLTVTAPTTGAFTISVSPTSGSLDQGTSGYAVITTTVSGGFDSAVVLKASGQPTGVTVSFSPASIAAPGSGTSRMLLSVARTAATGTYPITITGTGGGVTHTTTLTFVVRR